MKRLIKLFILCAVLMALVAVYFIAVLVANKSKDDSNDDSIGTGDQINTNYTAARIDVPSMYAIKYDVDGTQYCFSLNSDHTCWVWDDDEALPLENTYFATMATSLESITSDVKLNEDAESRKKYGLNAPALSVTVSDEKYGTQTLMFGTLNSFNGKCYFLSTANESNIYMVDASILSSFVYTPYQMVKNDTLPSIDPDSIRALTLSTPETLTTYAYYESGKDGDPQTDDFWYMAQLEQQESPVDAELSVLLPNIYGTVSFDSPVGYSSELHESFGLHTPARLTVTYSELQTVTDATTGTSSSVIIDKQLTLLLGYASPDGKMYVALEDSVLTYQVDASALSKIYTAIQCPTVKK